MTSHTPFQFVYGQEVILTIKLELPSLWIALNKRLLLDDSFVDRYVQYKKLDKIHWYVW
jgi:hypothetical protein